MCLIHDLGESFTGDIATFNKAEVDARKEDAAYAQWIKSFPETEKLHFQRLLEEIPQLETREAKSYKALDNFFHRLLY